MKGFEPINRAYNSVFKPDQLSIGVVVPIEHYSGGPVPTMKRHLERVKLVEELGFKALWVRDVPLNVPSFGDAGQTFDPFTYLGYLAGGTSKIALGVASIALPLHHPLHVAKSAATIDQLSDGRLILGVASGDRAEEYPAMGIAYEGRGASFRDAFQYIRKAAEDFPAFNTTEFGALNGQVDVLPKPVGAKVPMLITGRSRQALDWNATHGDGWINYPRDLLQQHNNITQWRHHVEEVDGFDKPFMQPLYVVLERDPDFLPRPIQLGFRIGVNYLVEYFQQLQNIGVNHVAINLRFNAIGTEKALNSIAEKVLPLFH